MYQMNQSHNTERGYNMRFKPILKSHHDLKKNGYKILRKLHKLQKRKNVTRTIKCDDTYYYVLSCKHLFEILNEEYGINANSFLSKCDHFLEYLECNRGNRIDPTVLSSFLKAYTKFFNGIIGKGIPFSFNRNLVDIWNTKCLMAYNVAWCENK